MKTLDQATEAKRESKHVEFKESVDVTVSGDMIELIKDIIAMATREAGFF